MFNEKRNNSPLLIFTMPHLFRNIPRSTFHDSFYSELLRIGKYASFFSQFIVKASKLYLRKQLETMAKKSIIKHLMNSGT